MREWVVLAGWMAWRIVEKTGLPGWAQALMCVAAAFAALLGGMLGAWSARTLGAQLVLPAEVRAGAPLVALDLDDRAAIVERFDDATALEIALIENLQRADLNPIEIGRGLQRLQEEFRMTQREIASKTADCAMHARRAGPQSDEPKESHSRRAAGETADENGKEKIRSCSTGDTPMKSKCSM